MGQPFKFFELQPHDHALGVVASFKLYLAVGG